MPPWITKTAGKEYKIMSYDFAFWYNKRNDKPIICAAVNYVEYTTKFGGTVKVIGDEIADYNFPLNADYMLKSSSGNYFASQNGLVMIQVTKS